MQGVVNVNGTFYISAACPGSFDNGYRESACVHKGSPGGSTSVLTAVPDMTQNLDWDSSTGRIRGVNEVGQLDRALPQRLVFDFAPTARSITTVRFKNVNSGMCLTPYGGSLNNGANIVQWACNGSSPQNWYWNGNEIRNFSSNRCLTVYGGSISDGAVMNQWDCNGSAAQHWDLSPGTAGGAIMINGGSGRCLTIYGGSVTQGADAVQWTCQADSTKHNWVGYTIP
ncbi:RICIN domain-containing protein [Kitasatospora terrestris]